MTAVMSIEQQQKASYAAVRRRLFLVPSPNRVASFPAPVDPVEIEPVMVERKKRDRRILIRRRYDSHVKQFRGWLRLNSEHLSPRNFVRVWCVAYGVDHSEMLSGSRKKSIFLYRKACIIECAIKYPKLSSTALGEIFNRDYTSVLYLLGQTKRSPWERTRDFGCGAYALIVEQVLEIRRRCDAGETQSSLASEFGVARATIHRIGNRISWKSIPEEA